MDLLGSMHARGSFAGRSCGVPAHFLCCSLARRSIRRSVDLDIHSQDPKLRKCLQPPSKRKDPVQGAWQPRAKCSGRLLFWGEFRQACTLTGSPHSIKEYCLSFCLTSLEPVRTERVSWRQSRGDIWGSDPANKSFYPMFNRQL